MLERFTEEARQTVVLARENARRLGEGYVGSEHVLLGLLDQPETLSARLLTDRGLDKAQAEATVSRLLGAAHRAAEQLDAGALASIGIDLSSVRDKVEEAFGPGALDRPPFQTRSSRPASGRLIRFSERAKRVLALALREALRPQHRHITDGRLCIADGHLLLGLLEVSDGTAAEIIVAAGIDAAALRNELEAQLSAATTPGSPSSC